jgi:hypothetical protein
MAKVETAVAPLNIGAWNDALQQILEEYAAFVKFFL